MTSKFRLYYKLTKPGIIRGNLITAAAGMFFAFKGSFNPKIFVSTLVGMGLVIGAACVFNNYIDRGIDKKMSRTKHRALVEGTISVRSALSFGALLLLTGFVILLWGTGFLTFLVGVTGTIFYVVVYGIGKRKTVHGTLIGTISGAMPLVAGYVAVTNHFDIAVLVLFLIMVTWQMPHFYAIAIYRLADYKAAKLPVLPAVLGIRRAKIEILLYIIAFIIATFSLTALGYAGYGYLAVMAVLGVFWLRLAILGFSAKDDAAWARKVFGCSLLVLLAFSLTLSIESVLH